jgi:hypothetical protein
MISASGSLTVIPHVKVTAAMLMLHFPIVNAPFHDETGPGHLPVTLISSLVYRQNHRHASTHARTRRKETLIGVIIEIRID